MRQRCVRGRSKLISPLMRAPCRRSGLPRAAAEKRQCSRHLHAERSEVMCQVGQQRARPRVTMYLGPRHATPHPPGSFRDIHNVRSGAGPKNQNRSLRRDGRGVSRIKIGRTAHCMVRCDQRSSSFSDRIPMVETLVLACWGWTQHVEHAPPNPPSLMTRHDISRRAKFRISTTSAESLGVLVGAAQERRAATTCAGAVVAGRAR
jgi:hypothetical protein